MLDMENISHIVATINGSSANDGCSGDIFVWDWRRYVSAVFDEKFYIVSR
jgi:hypothetical protein